MEEEKPSKGMKWAGIIFTILPALLFIMSAFMKLSNNPQVVEGFTKQGFPTGVLIPIGIVEITCLIIYLIPVTSVLGAVLLTGYLGGAICTHVRNGENFLPPLIVGFMVWGGIYFREKRLHSVLPLRKKQ